MTAPVPAKSGAGYRSYVLFLLTCVSIMNYVDRALIGILSPAIKQDLQLSDWELGLLKGMAFAVFYTLLSIPIARLADKHNRVSIVGLALATWSGFTVVSGLVVNLVQLALARFAVSIGEAGGTAPMHSIISDYFPKDMRAKALAIVGMGVPLGAGLGFLAGGGISQVYGWRVAFIAMGLPGIILAVLLTLTVREPVRGAHDNAMGADAFSGPQASGFTLFLSALKHLWAIPTWRLIVIAVAAATFSSAATGAWIVDLFARAHPDYQIGIVLAVLGLSIGIGFTGGTFLGGWLVERLSVANKAMYGIVPAAALAVNVPATLIWIWFDDPVMALIMQSVGAATVGFYFGPCYALIQSLAPVSIRTMSTAIFFLIVNIIGLGLGPTLVGAVSNLLAPAYGDAVGLRVGLTLVTLTSAYSAFVFWRMSKTVVSDWRIVEAN